MIKILRYLKWYDWLGIFSIFGLTVSQVFCDLKLPEYMVKILSSIQSGTKEVWANGGMIMLYVSISIAISIVISFLSSIIASKFANRLRRQVFVHVGSFSMAEINKFSTASLITRSTNDVVQIKQVLMMTMRMFLYAPIMAIMALIKITSINATLSWTTFAFVAVMLAFVVLVMVLVLKKFLLMQKQTDELNNVARENLTGIRVVRANNAEKLQEEKFEETNRKLTQTNLFVNRVTAFVLPIMNLIMSGLNIALCWIGAALILNPEVNTNFLQITEFSQYAGEVLMSFLMVSMLFVMIPRGAVSAKRILEVLDTKSTIQSGTKTQGDGSVGTIELKNVSFRYPGAEGYVLKNINLKIDRGQTIAFVGSTGSGKSTLINLVARFYDATEGEVVIDGTNIKNYRFSTLNAKLGYISQKSYMFNGTIAENVAYGMQDCTDEQINNALEIAQAKEFVDKLEGGLDFVIAQGGNNLSGGQKQRISIARALVRNPEILIFDDSFSALDYKTDKQLRAQLQQNYSKTTKLIVAQRIGTVLNADKIVVLENGEVVGVGTHSELMKNCDTYKQIALSQLSKEELENGTRN